MTARLPMPSPEVLSALGPEVRLVIAHLRTSADGKIGFKRGGHEGSRRAFARIIDPSDKHRVSADLLRLACAFARDCAQPEIASVLLRLSVDCFPLDRLGGESAPMPAWRLLS